MLRRRGLVAIVLVALLAAPTGLAAGTGTYPDPQKAPRYFDSACIAKFDRRFVYDYVDAIDTTTGDAIEAAACDVYNATGAHFVLAAVNDTGGEVLESYSLHLFERWGIGQKDRNDGVLLLYVKNYQLDGKPSALRVEVGYGLEGTIDSLVAADAIDLMREAKQRQLDAGATRDAAVSYALGYGSGYLLETLAQEYTDGHFPTPVPSHDPFALAGSVPIWVWIVAIVLVIALLGALTGAARSRGGWGYYPGSPHWSTGLGSSWVGRGGLGGGGFGGGGFGDGGFGGGRSGGGGGSGGF